MTLINGTPKVGSRDTGKEKRFDPSAIKSAKQLGKWLTARREEASLTIRQIAKTTGIPHSTVGGYFAGKHVPSPSRPESLFAILDALGIDPEPDAAAWRKTLRRLSTNRRQSGQEGDGPYQGLRPFTEATSQYFFGRDADIKSLVARVRKASRIHHSATTPLIVVVGASGSGKSSLVRAGLVPRLGNSWDVVTIEPGTDPLRTFVQARRSLTRLDATHKLLIVDQLEELWTLNPPGSSQAILEDLLRPAMPNTVIVATMRADLYGEATRIPILAAALNSSQMIIEPLSGHQLRESVTAPAELDDLTLEPGLVDRVVTDATSYAHSERATASLPHLSHCLNRMWEIRERNELTHAHYDAVGGLEGALAASAEGIYQSLSADDQIAARTLLLRLVAIEPGMPPMAAEVPLSAVAEEPEHSIVNELAKHRLVVVGPDTVQLSHEALLTAWPRMTRWVQESHDQLQLIHRVERDAAQWASTDHDPDLLPRGSALEAGTALEVVGIPLSEDAADFLRQGRESAELESERERARQRRLKRLLTATSVASVIAVIVCIALVIAIALSQQSGRAAVSRQFAAQSKTLESVDVPMAAQLALVANARADTLEGRSQAATMASLPATANINGATGVRFVAGSVGRQVLATAGAETQVKLFDVSGPKPTRVAALEVPANLAQGTQLVALKLSPDGAWLAAVGSTMESDPTKQRSKIRLWRLDDSGQPGTPLPDVSVTGQVNEVAFSADSSRMYAASLGTGIPTWTLASGTITPGAVVAPGEKATTVAVSPRGTVITGNDVGEVAVWDTANPSAPLSRQDLGQGRWLTRVALQRDRLAVASRSGDAVIASWDENDRTYKALDSDVSFTSWANDAAISPDGELIAFGSSDKVVKVVDSTLAVRETIPVSDNVTHVAFVGPRRVAIGAVDGQTIVRDLPPYPGNADYGSVYGVGWAADRPLAIAGAVGAGGDPAGPPAAFDVAVVDVANATRPRELSRITTRGKKGSGAGDISPSGKTVIAGSGDGFLYGWDVTDPAQPKQRFATRIADSNLEQAYYATDDTVLAPNDDGTVALVEVSDTAEPTIRTTLTAPAGTGIFFAATTNSDASLVVAGADHGAAFVWQPQTSTTPVAKISGAGTIYGVAMSHDGRYVALGGTDRQVRLYDLTNPASPKLVDTVAGGTGSIFLMEFSPTDDRLMASVNDGTLLIWSLNNAELTRDLWVPTGAPLYTGSWAPDGRSVIVGGQSGNMRVIPTSPRSASDALCATTGEWIAKERWASSLPEVDFSNPCGSS